MFRRVLAVLAFCAIALEAANVRLYLKDGGYHVVREYQVQTDRVRYYSVERGDWEEIPLSLVDVKRTESEIKQKDDQRRADAKSFDEEEAAERAQRQEIERIPYEPGVFQVAGETVKPLKQAELKTVSNKRRSLLKAISPVPMISGKQSVEVDGVSSAYVVDSDRPEFYFRLANEERFGILRAKPAKNARAVQTWTIVPVSKEIVEEFENIEVFKKQLVEGLYKIWPAKPLAPGEYAVYEYTEGAGNIQIWDFTVPAGGKSAN